MVKLEEKESYYRHSFVCVLKIQKWYVQVINSNYYIKLCENNKSFAIYMKIRNVAMLQYNTSFTKNRISSGRNSVIHNYLDNLF